MEFVPAGNKLEAVARISALTNSGPEELGPGSKERKSVVVNLANGLNLGIDVSGTKQGVAALIADALGQTWTSECESVGQTLTLKGLNLLLEHATKFLDGRLSKKNDDVFPDAQSEALAIGSRIALATPSFWGGEKCVKQMQEADSSNWRQTEWTGFYFEFCAIPPLINELGGGPQQIGHTKFDYCLSRSWDLKAHSVRGNSGSINHSSQLNDQESMREAIENGGLGLFVLSGEASYDPAFTSWHREFRGKPAQEGGRPLKSAFKPVRLEAFYIEDSSMLDAAMRNQQISEFKQGRQPSGEPRRPKYSINVTKSQGSNLQVFEHLFG